MFHNYMMHIMKVCNWSIGNDNDLCFTAGILSVINAVLLNNMSALQNLFDNYGITSEKFKERY